MRVVLNGHIVELRAKAYEEGKFTKTDTMNVMNWLSLCLKEAASYNKQIGCPACAKEMREAADNLYKKLEKYGYYNS